MLRQGPVPAFVHGATEYLAGPLFIAAPFLFGFDSNAARALSIVIGIVILIHTASSALPTGMAKIVPPNVHAVIDLALSAVLVAAPFVLGFSDEGAATAFFIVMGVLLLLFTIATRFIPKSTGLPPSAPRAGAQPGPSSRS